MCQLCYLRNISIGKYKSKSRSVRVFSRVHNAPGFLHATGLMTAKPESAEKRSWSAAAIVLGTQDFAMYYLFWIFIWAGKLVDLPSNDFVSGHCRIVKKR